MGVSMNLGTLLESKQEFHYLMTKRRSVISRRPNSLWMRESSKDDNHLSKEGEEKVNTVRSKRAWLDVAASILDVANTKVGVNKSRIVYKANLNFHRFERYIEVLMGKGLIEEHSGSGALLKTTERGREFLRRYGSMRELIWHTW